MTNNPALKAAPPSRGATSNTSTLEGCLSVLRAGKAGVEGIGVPGVEPVFSGLLEVVTRISTMKRNKDDLAALKVSLQKLAELVAKKIGETDGELKDRLKALLSKFGEKADGCEVISKSIRWRRLFLGEEDKKKIADIQADINADIQEFLFSGSISIEKVLRDLVLKAENDVLRMLKCSPARFNAEDTPDKCMDGTRVHIIQDILGRLKASPGSGHRVLILSGSAGSGKSTIAKTIATILAQEREKILAASFFFARDSAERNDLKLLPSTLARQLADHDDDFRHLLVELLQKDRDGILQQNKEEQFKKLVVELIARIPDGKTPWIICLDALDECGVDQGQHFLTWLSKYISEIPEHVRFFLTGRPNVPQYLRSPVFHPLTQEIVLDDLDADQVKHDIHLYVQRSLDLSQWPKYRWKASAQDVDKITSDSDHLFVFAATAVRYIRSAASSGDPETAVNYLLKGRVPLTGLHSLYNQIVDGAITKPESRDQFAQDCYDRSRRILRTIVLVREPQSPQCLATLLGISMDNLSKSLEPLTAVIHVPDTPEGGAIKIRHLSFREFLQSDIKDKRPDLLCGLEVQKEEMAIEVLSVMQEKLRFNICDLSTSYRRNVNIVCIESKIQKSIPEALQYACQFWADHLTSINYNAELSKVVQQCLLDKFLFWLEVLSLLGKVRSAQYALSKFTSWSKEDSQISFAKDGKRFIFLFADAIHQSAPHIYLSALALAPTQSEIAKRFQPWFQCLMSLRKGQMIKWPALVQVLNHSSKVNSVVFSQDGKFIASGTENGSVYRWNAESGEALGDPLEGHTDPVMSVAFSPDSKQIVSGSSDHTIRIWDASTGQAVGNPFIGHTDLVRSVSFSPDGKQIVSGSEDCTIRIWDAKSGQALGDPLQGHTDLVMSVAFSPDGKQIVSGSSDHTVQIWDIKSSQTLGDPLKGHTYGVRSVAFSPDGKKVVSGSGDRTIRIWDAKSGQALGDPLVGHTDSVRSVTYSPDGKWIVSGSEDSTIQIWDASRGQAVGNPLVGHTDWVKFVAISPDGKQIVSGSSDHTIRIWDVNSGQTTSDSEDHTNLVIPISFSPDGKRIVSGSHDCMVQTLNVNSGQSLGNPLISHSRLVLSVAFSPDGKQIVSGSGSCTVHMWDSNSGQALVDPLVGHTDWVRSVGFSPDGKHIVSGSDDCTLQIWDAKSGQALGDPLRHTDWVRSVAFSPDGNQILSASKDHTIRIWDAKSGQALFVPLTGHTDLVMSVAFSPDGERIVSGSSDHTIRIWDASSGQAIGDPLEGHTHSVRTVAFFPDGKQIVSCSDDCTIRIWDANSSRALGDSLKGHTNWVMSVALSPDGKQIVSGSSDRTVRIWDANSRQALGNLFIGHTNWVRCVAFSPDGKQIVSGSEDGTIRIWNAKSGRALQVGEPSAGLNTSPIILETAADSDIYAGSALANSVEPWHLDDGWVCSPSNELLVWLPSPNRIGLWTPDLKLVISRQQTEISFDNTVYGKEWAKCYKKQ